MKRILILAGTLAALAAGTSSATAQTPKAPNWFVGADVGAAAVDHVGLLGGGVVGRHLSPRADVFGEALYLQDIATRRRSESADKVASYLAASQGKAASGSIDAPTWAFSGGIRYFLTGARSLRPYLVGQGGMARVVLNPSFSLAGTDVTSTLGQYGVTLGSDLTGESTKPMFGGGFGMIAQRGAWYFDASLRAINVQLDDQPATAAALSFGFGRSF